MTRRLRFDLPKTAPKHWNGNCPIKTHLFNAIAILAPAFERLAITSVLPFKGAVVSPVLCQQLQGFIGQESAHGSEFIRYNQILRRQGYESKKLEKRNLKKFKWLANKFSPMMHLSLTLAAEHLTAIISDLLLREEQWLQDALPPFKALWRWHAIEEIEHKAVVYDVYQTLKGGYGLRLAGMILVTGMIGNLLLRNFFHLVLKDKLLVSLSFWRQLIKICWGKPGFIRKLLGPYCRYFLPHFHPWQQDNHELIAKWRKCFTHAQSLDEVVQMLQNATH